MGWRLAQRISNHLESLLGVTANGGNRTDTNDDDQCQHDGIFHSGRATLVLQEIDDMVGEFLHDTFLRKEKTNVVTGTTNTGVGRRQVGCVASHSACFASRP